MTVVVRGIDKLGHQQDLLWIREDGSVAMQVRGVEITSEGPAIDFKEFKEFVRIVIVPNGY